MMLTEVMSKYFDNGLDESFRPISSFKKVDWESSKNRLSKKYIFKDHYKKSIKV